MKKRNEKTIRRVSPPTVLENEELSTVAGGTQHPFPPGQEPQKGTPGWFPPGLKPGN